MRKILSLWLLMICGILAFCQNNFEDVVYFKNGSIIRGNIIEQIPNETLKIQTKDGNVFVCNLIEVQKITKEAPYRNPEINQSIQTLEKPVQKNQAMKMYLRKGFIGVTEIGSLFARKISDKNNAGFSFNQLLGKRTSQTFSIGMALGIDINKYVLYVPVTVDSRIYFIKKRITPFINLAPGYAMLLIKSSYEYNSEIYHAFITNFGLGIEYKITTSLGISLNIGGRLSYFPKQNSDFIGGSGFMKIGIIY